MSDEEFIEIDGDKHRVGNKNCEECWGNYPRKHKDCGGLVHSAFGDENYDGDYWLYTKCDKCYESGIDFEDTEELDES